MAEMLEKTDDRLEPEEASSGVSPEDTVVDFLPINEQALSQFEADRLENLINQNSPYRQKRSRPRD